MDVIRHTQQVTTHASQRKMIYDIINETYCIKITIMGNKKCNESTQECHNEILVQIKADVFLVPTRQGTE